MAHYTSIQSIGFWGNQQLGGCVGSWHDHQGVSVGLPIALQSLEGSGQICVIWWLDKYEWCGFINSIQFHRFIRSHPINLVPLMVSSDPIILSNQWFHPIDCFHSIHIFLPMLSSLEMLYEEALIAPHLLSVDEDASESISSDWYIGSYAAIFSSDQWFHPIDDSIW